MRLLLLMLGFWWFGFGCVTTEEEQKKEVKRLNILRPDSVEEVSIMKFDQPISLDPIAPGWHHETFMRSEPMIITFEEKVGFDAIRLDTRDMGSMLFRHVEIPLMDYPFLNWRWMVEAAIEGKVDETTRDGDDHPARIFVGLETAGGSKKSFELIWANRVKHRTIFRIDDFPHYVVRNNSDGLGIWHTEKLNLSAIYEEIFEESPAGIMVVEIAVMADSDNTDVATTAFFSEIKMTAD